MALGFKNYNIDKDAIGFSLKLLKDISLLPLLSEKNIVCERKKK